ncbi:MAG: hypothetical protein ABW042_05235 [Phenylobacterium sp.]
MIVLRPKLWTSLSAAVLLGASVGACGQGETGADAPKADAPAAKPAEAVGEGGEAAEMGAAAAYGAIPAASKTALQLSHLEGFFLIAKTQPEGADYAAALAGQGMLEVYDKDPAAFQAAGVDKAVLDKAVQSGAPADLDAAIANLRAARAKSGGDAAEVVKALVGIGDGIYKGVEKDGAIDSVEYQHSLGSILAAQEVASREGGGNAKLAAAKADLDKLAALWPKPVAPEKVTPAGQVSAQAARVQLALS